MSKIYSCFFKLKIIAEGFRDNALLMASKVEDKVRKLYPDALWALNIKKIENKDGILTVEGVIVHSDPLVFALSKQLLWTTVLKASKSYDCETILDAKDLVSSEKGVKNDYYLHDFEYV